MKTRDARTLSPDAQEDLRIKAVKAVLDDRKKVEVADLFGVTRQAVGKWTETYRKGGKRALRAKKRGRPKGNGALLPWQAAQIVRALEDRCPEQLKLPFYLWTREAVAELIKRRFNIELSIWTVGRYLARWGFTPQIPVRRAYEQDPEEVQRWLEEEYPAIRQQAKREKAIIHWGDEMGLRSDHTVGRSYGRRGHTPVIPGTGKRFRCNMISTITNQGKLYFMIFKNKFTTIIFLAFLKRLLRQVNRKVFLIIDKHSVHMSGNAQAWLKKNSHRIKVFFLPSYSPELNPDEVLNQDVKSNALGRHRPHTQAEMIFNLHGYLRSRQRQPRVVRRYFEKENVRYAAV